MFYQGQMMNQNEGSCGCGCSQGCPTCQQCNQVVQTCNVQDVPHYINYHTHVVNNCIKRHINIPTYSTSTENVYYDEYVQGQPIYQQPVMVQQQPMYMQQQQMVQPTVDTQLPNYGPQGYQGMVNPMNPFNN